MAEEQITTAPTGSRIIFSSYDAGSDFSWSVRWKPTDGSKPVVMARSAQATAKAIHPIMQEFWKDPRVEAILANLMRRHGEP